MRYFGRPRAVSICFTLPEFYGDTVTHNEKTIDSMADIQLSPIKKSNYEKDTTKAQLFCMGH